MLPAYCHANRTRFVTVVLTADRCALQVFHMRLSSYLKVPFLHVVLSLEGFIWNVSSLFCLQSACLVLECQYPLNVLYLFFLCLQKPASYSCRFDTRTIFTILLANKTVTSQIIKTVTRLYNVYSCRSLFNTEMLSA